VAPPEDQEQRYAAIHERERNVVIEAGAGTGKTSTLVQRLLELVAPLDGGPAMRLSRVAAITFTRKAAGELGLRIRESLLAALADEPLTTPRRQRLRQALGDLDTAWVGTIHSFADRLLRLNPAEAGLSPNYEIARNDDELIEETYEQLLRGAETGTLDRLLAGSEAEEQAREAAATVVAALGAGVLAQTQETGFAPRAGLDALVREFIRQRDVPPVMPAATAADLEAVRQAMVEFRALAQTIAVPSDFGDWAQALAETMAALMAEEDPAVLFAEMVVPIRQRCQGKLRKGQECGGDAATWGVCKALTKGGKDRGEADLPPLGEALTGPLDEWLGRRLVRLSPVVLGLYQATKRRRGVVDPIDLLLLLRNVLRDNPDARTRSQALFDHLLVDEFQDTDPLQAEIVQFLCEAGPPADAAAPVRLAPGRLTVVGDPKQSIYRFRRADVEAYARFVEALAPTALQVQLRANFRTVPTLTGWFNQRFPALLGASPDGSTFAPETGQVYHRDLAAGRRDDRTPALHVLRFDTRAADSGADEYRTLEGEALAYYLRWLVEQSGTLMPGDDGGQRPVAYDDICVLALATTHLPVLFRQLDRLDIPYAAAGGTLFLGDPLQRQFLLALRALADPDDGMAQAALLRPPFFAVDLRDLLAHRTLANDPAAARAAATLAVVDHLRRQRHERPPGVTARALLDGTACGRAVALGPNGQQRLHRLREVCHLLAQTAAEGGLDYDGATAALRQWVNDPQPMDAPRPVAERVVQVMTVHQAKGLEFPVVVLWDGRARVGPHDHATAWRVADRGRQWCLALYGLQLACPADAPLAAREKRYLEHERRRLVYVAATRARELLVLPQAGPVDEGTVAGLLIGQEHGPAVDRLPVFAAGSGASWSQAVYLQAAVDLAPADELVAGLERQWLAAAAASGRSRWPPVAASVAAHGLDGEADDGPADAPRERRGRYGARFGTVVHRALAACLEAPQQTAPEAVASAAVAEGLVGLQPEATEDVRRSLAALAQAGLLPGPGATVRLEYPLAGPGDAEELLLACADFVHYGPAGLTIVDFKSDTPPTGPVAATYPAYVRQVQTYGRLLRQVAALAGPWRCGLLFTASGDLHWVGGTHTGPQPGAATG
jgi:ATP-dependent helicase/nuclease subunit A